MNKRKRDILTIVVILIILLLLVGAFLIKGRNQTTETKLPSTEEQGEFIVKTEQDDAKKTGDSDTFLDGTTNQNQATDAGKKGGSETLEIISSEEETESNEESGQVELIWLPDAW